MLTFAEVQVKQYRDPLKAGLLALLVPGAGQVFTGQAVRGLTYFLGVLVGLFLFIAPGVVIWLASVGDAVRAARRINATAEPLDLPVEPSPLAPIPVQITDGPPQIPPAPVTSPDALRPRVP